MLTYDKNIKENPKGINPLKSTLKNSLFFKIKITNKIEAKKAKIIP